MAVESPVSRSFVPRRPSNLDDTGLTRAVVQDLILKTIYFLGAASTRDLATSLKLPYFGLLEPLVEGMRDGELLYTQPGREQGTFEFVLTKKGVERVIQILDRNQYVGPAPVPLALYSQAVQAQSSHGRTVTREVLQQAFSHLILSQAMLDEIGPALNSGTSIFLFGPPGNGKTTIAEVITHVLGGDIYVPYAVEVDGQIVKLYESTVHRAATTTGEQGAGSLFAPYDARWVFCRRPVVVVGGELTMSGLDLIYEPRAGFYEAPLQMKANNGVFMIDDFGRQQIAPRELLNRWIVPLEKRHDYLTLHTGKKIEVPFEVLIIFSTNLKPKDLVDEAFLRRIRYKVNVESPTEAEFRQIFQMVCQQKGVPYDDAAVTYLLTEHYQRRGLELRACHPRDLVSQLVDIAGYRKQPPTLARDLLDLACLSYFVDLKD